MTTTRTPTTAPTIAGMTATPTAPLITATPLPAAFVFGKSVNGTDLTAYRYGTGGKILLLVGGIHAGFEANTVDLMNELRDYFSANPASIQPDVSIVIVPSLNPDGLTYGRQLRGRFNGNGVDLNRNWGCGWSESAVFRTATVDPGGQPFSEPETTALGAFIQQARPATVLFYHAAANGVYGGSCDGQRSDELVQVYGDASGYPYGSGDSVNVNNSGGIDYDVTGSAPAWVRSQGIPSADIELATADGTEFVRNLRAIMAVQAWLSDSSN